MSTSKHTPGPWKAEVYEKSASINILGRHGDAMRCRASDGHGSIVIVDCAAGDHEGAPFAPMLTEQLANAALIAAAPELQEALQSAVTVLKAFAAMSAEQGWAQDEIDAALGLAGPALAKAGAA